MFPEINLKHVWTSIKRIRGKLICKDNSNIMINVGRSIYIVFYNNKNEKKFLQQTDTCMHDLLISGRSTLQAVLPENDFDLETTVKWILCSGYNNGVLRQQHKHDQLQNPQLKNHHRHNLLPQTYSFPYACNAPSSHMSRSHSRAPPHSVNSFPFAFN